MYFFLAALVLNIATTLWHLVSKDGPAALPPQALASTVIGWLVLAAVCLYSWRLAKRGVLV